MGMGGDFYALTDDQLERLLDGRLAYGRFLHFEGEEFPRECLSDFEHFWFELTQVLAPEDACGAMQGEEIPELCGYSDSEQVARTAARLEALDEAMIRRRCERADIEAPLEEIVQAVHAVIAFYRRAAQRQSAVLFRVT